jgi:hypothetical protein
MSVSDTPPAHARLARDHSRDIGKVSGVRRQEVQKTGARCATKASARSMLTIGRRG